MAWTATLEKLQRENGKWSVIISYSDSVDTHRKGYTFERITKKQLRDLARAEAARLAETETTDINIPIGTNIDVTPDPTPTPTPPTQAELDEAAWFTDWDQLQSIQRVLTAIPSLSTTARQTQVTNLQTSLDAGWKNAYLARL